MSSMSKRRVFCGGCAAISLLMFGVRVEGAHPSAKKLNQMGLSGAQVVSDSVAQGVRGLGYRGGNKVRVWSTSTIVVNGVTFQRSSTSNPARTFVAVPLGGGGFLFAGGSASVRVGGR